METLDRRHATGSAASRPQVTFWCRDEHYDRMMQAFAHFEDGEHAPALEILEDIFVDVLIDHHFNFERPEVHKLAFWIAVLLKNKGQIDEALAYIEPFKSLDEGQIDPEVYAELNTSKNLVLFGEPTSSTWNKQGGIWNEAIRRSTLQHGPTHPVTLEVKRLKCLMWIDNFHHSASTVRLHCDLAFVDLADILNQRVELYMENNPTPNPYNDPKVNAALDDILSRASWIHHANVDVRIELLHFFQDLLKSMAEMKKTCGFKTAAWMVSKALFFVICFKTLVGERPAEGVAKMELAFLKTKRKAPPGNESILTVMEKVLNKPLQGDKRVALHKSCWDEMTTKPPLVFKTRQEYLDTLQNDDNFTKWKFWNRYRADCRESVIEECNTVMNAIKHETSHNQNRIGIAQERLKSLYMESKKVLAAADPVLNEIPVLFAITPYCGDRDIERRDCELVGIALRDAIALGWDHPAYLKLWVIGFWLQFRTVAPDEPAKYRWGLRPFEIRQGLNVLQTLERVFGRNEVTCLAMIVIGVSMGKHDVEGWTRKAAVYLVSVGEEMQKIQNGYACLPEARNMFKRIFYGLSQKRLKEQHCESALKYAKLWFKSCNDIPYYATKYEKARDRVKEIKKFCRKNRKTVRLF